MAPRKKRPWDEASGHPPVLQFVELLNSENRRLHVGCVLHRGKSWVEISVPRALVIDASHLLVRFHPSPERYATRTMGRQPDSIRLEFIDAPPVYEDPVTSRPSSRT